MAHDSSGSDTFSVTHEFLATLLSVQRAGITLRLNALQSRGLIRCGRGEVTIINRKGLESEACECYGAIRGYVDRIFDEDH